MPGGLPGSGRPKEPKRVVPQCGAHAGARTPPQSAPAGSSPEWERRCELSQPDTATEPDLGPDGRGALSRSLKTKT